MAYSVRVVEVMIASPGDVVAERQAVREVLNAWNVVHARSRKALLVPVGWETHSVPELGGRPQQMINDRLLAHCDLLVGLFWTRLGSPTGVAASGTVEEIEEHIKAGKPAMLYFSKAPVVPDSLDAEQYAKLKEFKVWARTRGLVAEFESTDEFRESFRRDLELTLRDNGHLADELLPRNEDHQDAERTQRVTLNDESVKLLVAAAKSDGQITNIANIVGTNITAGGAVMVGDHDSPREVAKWAAGLEELEAYDLIRDVTSDREVFQLTHAGWETAAKLVNSNAPNMSV